MTGTLSLQSLPADTAKMPSSQSLGCAKRGEEAPRCICRCVSSARVLELFGKRHYTAEPNSDERAQGNETYSLAALGPKLMWLLPDALASLPVCREPQSAAIAKDPPTYVGGKASRAHVIGHSRNSAFLAQCRARIAMCTVA